MGTIYRRYAGMDELLRAVCEQAMREWVEAADAALATDDPWEGLVSFVRAAVGFRAGVFEQAAGSFTPTPTMIELAGHGQELLEKIVARARVANDVRADVTATDIRDLMALFSRRVDDAVPRTLGIVIDGLRADGATSALPAPGDEWSTRTGRWAGSAAPPDGAQT